MSAGFAWKTCCLALLVVLLVLAAVPVHAEYSLGVYYKLVYNLLENAGVLQVDMYVSGEGCTLYRVPVAIFNENSTTMFLNYTYEGLSVAGFDYVVEEGYLEAYVCGSGKLTAFFEVQGAFEELGVGSYSTTVDTLVLEDIANNTAVIVELGIPVNISLQTTGRATAVFDEDKGLVNISGFGLAFISVAVPVEVTETTPITPTTPVTPTATPTTPLTRTPTPTATPQTTKPVPQPLEPYLYYAAVVVVVIVAVLAALAVKRRTR